MNCGTQQRLTMTKINWEFEMVKSFLVSKGYEYQYPIGSINYTCHIFQNNIKRIEVWDDRSGDLIIVDVNNKSVKLEEL